MANFKNIAAFAFASMLAASANAAVITYDFTATIFETTLYEPDTVLDSRLAGLPFQQGAVITGTFRYDTAMKPASVQPPTMPRYTQLVRYENPEINAISYSVNGFEWASMPSLNSRKTNLVRDGDAGYARDEVQLHTLREEEQMTSYASLNFFDWEGYALDDTRIPETFDLAYYFTLDGWFDDLRSGGYLGFNAEITSLTRVETNDVPEPGAALLLAAGAAALAGARRKRRAAN